MLGPAIYLDNPIFKYFLRHVLTVILNFFEWFGQYEAVLASSSIADLSHRACTKQIYSPLCQRLWNRLLNANDDLKTSLVKLSNTPAGNKLIKKTPYYVKSVLFGDYFSTKTSEMGEIVFQSPLFKEFPFLKVHFFRHSYIHFGLYSNV